MPATPILIAVDDPATGTERFVVVTVAFSLARIEGETITDFELRQQSARENKGRVQASDPGPRTGTERSRSQTATRPGGA